MRTSIFVLLSFILAACSQVFFAQPQPTRGVVVRSFPDNLLGEYSDSVLDVSILTNAIHVGSDKYELTKGIPDDNQVIVRYYKNFYFASFHDEEYYQVFMGSFYDSKLAVYMLNADEHSIDIIGKIVEVDTICSENGTFLIDPSRRQFDALIENELFDVLGVLERK
jgi:hypothetical protein